MAEKDKSTRKVSDYLEYDKDSRIFDSGVANGMMMLGMDIYQATQNVKAANEKQEDLKADTAERYGLLSDTDLDAFLAEEYKKELSKEYLVDGAILTCTNCTKEDVPIRLHNAVEIKSCVQIFEEIDASNFTEPADRVYGRLVVSENTDANVQGVKYATVGDSEKGYNIPFFGNCKRGPHCEEERKAFITQNNENNNEQQEKYPITRNVGSCKHLMKLEKEWENYPIEGSYFSFFDTKKEGSGAEKAGITMTSMLFCKHGGLIYPVTSGQRMNDIENDKEELIKLILETLGWQIGKEELNRLSSVLNDFEISDENSIVCFLLLCVSETGEEGLHENEIDRNGEKYRRCVTEYYPKGYEFKVGYAFEERGVGYIQITWRESQLECLKYLQNSGYYKGNINENAQGYVDELRELAWEASAWCWAVKKQTGEGNLNQYIVARTAENQDQLTAGIVLTAESFINGTVQGEVSDVLAKIARGEVDWEYENGKIKVNGKTYPAPNNWEKFQKNYDNLVKVGVI